MATISWIAGVSGDFAVASNWNAGTVPGAADTAEIEASGTYIVSSSASENVVGLALSQGAELDLTGGTFEVSVGAAHDRAAELSLGAAASIVIDDGATLELGAGSRSDGRIIDLSGSITVAVGGELEIAPQAGVDVSGHGTITLAGPGSEIDVTSQVPGNFFGASTIQGAGLITGPGTFFSAQLVDSDQTGTNLVVETGGYSGPFFGAAALISIFETPLEATNGGGLELLSDQTGVPLILDSGSTLDAVGSGSHVDLNNALIYMGRIATSAGGVIRTLAGGGTLADTGNSGMVEVGDGMTLSLMMSIANTGVIAVGSTGDATDVRLESEIDFRGQDTSQSRITALTGDGTVSLSDDPHNVIFATHAIDVLDNESNTISGAGQIGDGSAMGLDNDGVIDATGTNALVIDIAGGKSTNGAHGLLEGSGGGGLQLTSVAFTDIGTIEALDGSSVTFGAGATLSNDFKGTLTGGVWEASDTGDGATLDLNGADITTDAAKIVLSGAGSVFETGSTALETSLTTIASTGKLELLADRAWSSELALTDDGLLQLGGGGFDAAGLTVGSGGEVAGFGSIASALANTGVVQAYRGDLVLSGSITGSGTLKVFGSSTLEIGGSLASSQGVAFATGVHAVLKLDDPSAFASTIADLGLGDTIDLASTDATGAQISGDTLAITLMGGGTLNYNLTDPGSNVRIMTSSDGHGGTDLTMATISWNSAVSGDFADASNWSTGTVPGPNDTAHIQQPGTYTVTSSADESVQRVTVGADVSLDLTAGTFGIGLQHHTLTELTVDASASIVVGAGAILELGSLPSQAEGTAVTLDGAISIASGGLLKVAAGGDTEAVGSGIIDLLGSKSEIDIAGQAFQVAGTIEGAGLITSSVVPPFGGDILFSTVGTMAVIDADRPSAELAISLDVPYQNPVGDPGGMYASTLEATSGGTLDISSGQGAAALNLIPVGPSVVEAVGAGSIVDLDNVLIQHGTLDVSAGGIIDVISRGATLWGYIGQDGEQGPISNIGDLVVTDGVTLGFVGGVENTGTISLASTGDATRISIESLVDFPESPVDDSPKTRIVTLTGDGSIILSDNAANLISATHATDSLDNNVQTISGAGAIGGGAAMTFNNDGAIDATGVNALAINLGAGAVTDQVHGVFEATGSGGLSLSGGRYKIIGTVEALDGSSVTFGAGATLSNSANGTLTGGVWEAIDTGDGATLDLNGAAVTTDAAKIVLSGVGSVFETGSTALETSLTTIASTGKLELLADRAWSSALALTDDGFLQLGGGTFAAAGLTLGASGTLSGFGDVSSSLANAGLVDGDGAGLTLAGSVTNSGTISADRGTVDLTGSVTGSGTLKVYGSSTLEIGGPLASSQGVAFATGIHAVLKLDDPSAFSSTIADLGLGDTIDLVSTDATSAQISGDTLAITLMGGGTLNYSLTDPGSNVQVVLSSDGSGGTDLTLYKETAKSVARMSERMAGMAASGGTELLPANPTAASPSLAALATPGGG